MAAFSSYQVKIAGSATISTTIADSSSLVDSFLYAVWEINNDFKVGMNDDDQKVVEVVGVAFEYCHEDGDGSIGSTNINNKVATLQLCYGSCGILIQLLHFKEIPSGLRTFFADDHNFAFVGVGIRDAFAKLERDYGLKCNVIELGTVASRICRKSHFFDSNLEELAREIAGINIEKPTIPGLSLWGARDLRNEQIDYAITKAYASYSIGDKLMRRDIKK